MPKAILSIQKFVLYHALVIWRTKAFWMRAILCWAIGAAALLSDDFSKFDSRLQVRGPQKSNADIVIVDISERDWSALDPDSRNILKPLKEVVSLSDAFFWNQRSWERLLRAILADKPAAVGVTFYFGENIRVQNAYSIATKAVFQDPRIVWGADVDGAGRVLLPAFSTSYNTNVGLRSLRADDDGTVRRFSSSQIASPHLSVRLAEMLHGSALNPLGSQDFQQPTLINYVGPAESFRVISFKDIVENRIDSQALSGKIVLIGSLANPVEQMQTPLGRMSRTEIMANIIDNVIFGKNVSRLPVFAYLSLLIVLMMGSLWVLISYPQSVALVFFVMTGVIWSSLSAWAFDVGHVWIPVLAPLLQLVATYIIFLSYRLTLNEQRTWRLEQEQRYLSEIEQLKTNFVSMMSHDLKTPIAKIQAICDRLLATHPESTLVLDLKSLRRSSDDLHRYIQSILQVTKVEAKDFKISKEVTDINEDIERVISRVSTLAHEKNIRLESNLEPMFSIEADTTLIQEVILNLIENAIKYTPEGGRVTVTSRERDDNVEVIVEDTGPGIAASEQKEIWGKFIRGRSQQDATKTTGTGLGLYLVKYFIELHGGKVYLESRVGEGTRIGFSIPITDESVAPQEALS
jgi:two-component system, OmpR family, phosphate regulon sensor histidine kinase PhoR